MKLIIIYNLIDTLWNKKIFLQSYYLKPKKNIFLNIIYISSSMILVINVYKNTIVFISSLFFLWVSKLPNF